MDYLLDTNIIIIYSRDSEMARRIEQEYQLFNKRNRLAISVVTLGELDALAKKLGYGERKLKNIENLVSKLAILGINSKEVIEKYGDIDAFSQGKLPKNKFSARNMGKNDIWIASTASAFDLTLVTSDKDFEHLKGEYLKLEYIDIQEYKS